MTFHGGHIPQIDYFRERGVERPRASRKLNLDRTFRLFRVWPDVSEVEAGSVAATAPADAAAYPSGEGWNVSTGVARFDLVMKTV